MVSNDPINSIFFERQQAALCAQHALNMLLQDSLFTYENLRDLARQMDRLENEVLGNNADAVGRSENMNDSGFFSIQVIVKALEAFDLRLTNIENPEMAEYKANPLTSRAYICNLREHWFVLRKFGDQWFELNSINRGPKLLSNTYVREFMHQLSVEGYSIFVVQGILPNSEADNLISLCPVVVQPSPRKEKKPETMVSKFFNTVGRRLGGSTGPVDSQEDRELAIAMAMSMETETGDPDEDELEKAIKMSLGVKSREGSVEKAEASESSNDLQKAVATSTEAYTVTETPILARQTSASSSSGSVNMDSAPLSTSPKASEGVPTPSGPLESSGGVATGASSSSVSPISSTSSTTSGTTPSQEQQRRDREKFLERFEQKNKKKE